MMQAFEYLVFPKLALKDLVELKQVNKQFYSKINLPVIMCKKIENKLREILGEKYAKFAKVMYKCRAIIAGSFVLQCILDEVWTTFDRDMQPQARDIDLYVSCQGYGEKGNDYYGSIYSKQDKRNQDRMRKFLQTLTGKVEPDHHGMYKSLFRRLLWLENFYFNNKKEGDTRPEREPLPYEGTKLIEYEDETKFQLICIETDETHSLWDHINSTGFAICRNRVTFDKKGKMVLFMSRPLEIIHKKSTFVLQNIDKLTCAVKIFHGTEDRIINVSHSKELYDKLPNKKFPPTYLLDTGHNNILDHIDISDLLEVIYDR